MNEKQLIHFELSEWFYKPRNMPKHIICEILKETDKARYVRDFGYNEYWIPKSAMIRENF